MYDEIMMLLGLTPSPDMDDAAKINAIKDAIAALVGKGEPPEDDGSGQQPQVPMSGEAAAGAVAAPALATPGATVGATQPQSVTSTVKFSRDTIPQTMVNATKAGRMSTLEALVLDGTIIPAQKIT